MSHHLVELSCLVDGEIWHGLSYIEKSMHLVVHSFTHEAGLQKLVIKNLKGKGFECAAFSGLAVRDAIETRWGTIDNFNRWVKETIVNVLELRNMTIFLLSLSSYASQCMNTSTYVLTTSSTSAGIVG